MISAVILTKNEEEKIGECLGTLKFCDEIVVVDDNSSDKTREIAEKSGAKVFVKDSDMDFASQSNFGLEKAKGEWVFFVDADERITTSLRDEIVQITNKQSLANERIGKQINRYKGFSFKRIDYIWGKWLKHGESGSWRGIRLIKRGSGKWKRRAHQYFEIEGSVAELKHPIKHYPHPTMSAFIYSINRWSSWHAIANREEGKKSSLVKIFFWPLGHFVTNYFFRFGFRDGIQGFVFAFLMSLHSFLAWGKLWILQKDLNKI